MARRPSGAVAPLRLAQPLTTAYILGLLSSTSPRLARILFLFGKGKLTVRAAWLQTIYTLREALALHRFPTFCAVLVGGSTILQVPIKAVLDAILPRLGSARPLDLGVAQLSARFLAALASASISFKLLNNAPMDYAALETRHSPVLNRFAPGPFDEPPEENPTELTFLSRPDLAGRTIDLTLFAVIRALDVLVGTTTSSLKPTSPLRKATSKLPTPLFCFSAATIMWAWFYSPSRLPRSYNAWISAAAELDHRLVLALRHARYGTFEYGKDTGMAPLLGSMARDYGLPEDAGDPAKTVPVPCELVHMGCGESCEKHALWRFWRGWVFAAKMYFPLQLFVLARHVIKTGRAGTRLVGLTRQTLLTAIKDATRRSSFLGAFIAFFYYGVCLARTRLGPKTFSRKTVTPQMWDSGLCVLSGCLICGLGILLEESKRRLEIVLFVLPRAAATWFPRRYLPENRWKEQVAFALSAAVIMTAAQQDHRRVRGVFGRVLHRVLKAE
ncbi:integral membrane protein [Stagonosporopsis vannaccii]|nr:integral membrane protein [Stagonosporopsis vannaccii]